MQNEDKNDSNANVAQDSDEDFDFALTSSSFVCHSNKWVLDSACTFHMCLKKEWFYNLEESELGSVIMGNDQTCEILGKGKIKLKLHDGTILFLSEVQYVPNLKRNLILVGLLESKGFKIAMENGTLKVLYGALVVTMATRHRNMYFPKGSTVVGGVAIREVTLDTIRHLGHANDSALFESANNCKFEVCEPYALEKQNRVKFGTVVHHTKGILDYVHIDV